MRPRRAVARLTLAGLSLTLAACGKPPAPGEVIAGHTWTLTSGPAKGTALTFGAGQEFTSARAGRPARLGRWEMVTPTTVKFVTVDYGRFGATSERDTRYDVTVLAEDRVVFARGTTTDTLKRVDSAP